MPDIDQKTYKVESLEVTLLSDGKNVTTEEFGVQFNISMGQVDSGISLTDFYKSVARDLQGPLAEQGIYLDDAAIERISADRCSCGFKVRAHVKEGITDPKNDLETAFMNALGLSDEGIVVKNFYDEILAARDVLDSLPPMDNASEVKLNVGSNNIDPASRALV